MRIKNDSLNLKTLFWVLANQISSKTHFRNAKKINEMRTKLTTPTIVYWQEQFPTLRNRDGENCNLLRFSFVYVKFIGTQFKTLMTCTVEKVNNSFSSKDHATGRWSS